MRLEVRQGTHHMGPVDYGSAALPVTFTVSTLVTGPQIKPSNHLQGLQKNLHKPPVSGAAALWAV
jgi:hypothetical protein